MNPLTFALVFFLYEPLSALKFHISGRLICPGGRSPASSEIQLWDYDQPDADDFGGTTAADEQGYFELQGKVSDAFSSPEPYLKINGGCKTEGSFRHSRYCIDLVEQTYGLPCASDAVTSLTKEGEVIVYKSLLIELDGRNTRPKSFC